jgi:MoaA/NifB/PqqE/SkfB family radical SAM enzyme
MKEKPRDLSLGEIKEIAGQVPGLMRTILHGIGEPLLNRELPDIIGYLKEREVHVLFNSSALLLSKKWAQQLVSSGLDELRVSLDAAAESTYARVRGSDNFLKVVKNIEALVQMRKACHRSTPKVSVWMVATQENVEDLPEMIKLADRVEIDEVYLQRLVYPTDGPGYGLAVKEKTITDPSPRIVDILRRSMSLSRHLGVSLMASGLVSPIESVNCTPRDATPWRQCRRPWEVAYITAWGNVLPCCISPFSTVDYSSLILGNVFEQPLDRIWQGEKYRAFRQMHQSPHPPSCCIGCGVEWSL